MGVCVTFDDKLVTFVGDIPRKGQMTIFKFPSKQAAKDWYADESYQALSEFRRAGLTLGHGLLWRFDSLV